jgi:hypothetical protein
MVVLAPAFPLVPGESTIIPAPPAPTDTVSLFGAPGPTTGAACVFGMNPGTLDITPPAPPPPEA